MHTTLAYYLLILPLTTWLPCSALQILPSESGLHYVVYEPTDSIPIDLLKSAEKIYFDAYDPGLHEGLTLEEMKIDATKFMSYEEFIKDMFEKDFESYAKPSFRTVFFTQNADKTIVAICAILHQECAGYYYIDHIGVNKTYQHQGIGGELIEQVKNYLPNASTISLDTRIFNTPAQNFYEKMGFQQILPHPNPLKTKTYCHYVLNPG